MSVRCKNGQQLKAQSKSYDVLIAGSDQIWSPVWFNPAYYLDFADDVPKVSYAASLGVREIRSSIKRRKIRRLIQPYSAISVREEEGAALLQSMTQKQVAVMPDPVMLLTREQWAQIEKAPNQKEPYIVCYFIGNRDDYWDTVRQTAQSTGSRVVVIPVTDASYHQGYELAEGLSPQEWLGMLHHAECVITDSFHAAAFSVIFGTRLKVIRRYSEIDPASKNSRIDQLFRNIGLEFGTEETDSAVVTERLTALRQQGLQYLQTAFEEIPGKRE
ncbi:MAG: polysaccharide pyruvyl transferase family protein [Clostridia bacterium]|nr:polysaccharide pyruvyl transferase family protein [Clostridia bacterium]